MLRNYNYAIAYVSDDAHTCLFKSCVSFCLCGFEYYCCIIIYMSLFLFAIMNTRICICVYLNHGFHISMLLNTSHNGVIAPEHFSDNFQLQK